MDLELTLELAWEDLPESILDRFEDVVALHLMHGDITDTLLVIEIEADYTPYCPGRYAGDPGSCYPAEEADVEVLGHVIGLAEIAPGVRSPSEEAFLSCVLQYARDWLEADMDEVRTKLLEKGKSIHADEISEILAEVEMAIEDERERREQDFRDGAGIEDQVRGAVADWVARRTNSPEEK